MMPEFFAVIATLAQIAVLLFGIFYIVRRFRSAGEPAALAFFLFAMISLLMSDLYWLTYDLMRPEARMPFAANEVGEWAVFLLLASVLSLLFGARFGNTRREMLGAAVFALGSAALWIAWSGEWLQDILCGAAFGWLLCEIARALKLTGAFTGVEWALVWTGCAALLSAQTATLFAREPLKSGLDTACYAMLLLGMAFCVGKAVLARKAEADRQIALSFCALAWAVSCMYMSSGVYYAIAYAVSTLSLLLTIFALRKAVRA